MEPVVNTAFYSKIRLNTPKFAAQGSLRAVKNSTKPRIQIPYQAE